MDSLLVLISGLGLGAIASGHCALMCGGLVASLRLCSARSSPLLWLGRLISYTALGGLAGSVLSWLPRSELAADVVRIAFVLSILLAVIALRTPQHFASRQLRSHVAGPAGTFFGFWPSFAPRVRALVANNSGAARFGLGLFWGLLPCAALHTTLVAASISGSANNGALLLFGFAAGTSPVLWWTERRFGLPIAHMRWALLLLPLPLLAHPAVLPWLIECVS